VEVMANATTFIEEIVVSGSTTQTVDFTSISQAYDDLIIYGSGRNLTTSQNEGYTRITFNSDATSNYSWGRGYVYGTQVYGGEISTSYDPAISHYAGSSSANSNVTPGTLIMYLPRYSNTTYKKSGRSRFSELTNAAQFSYATSGVIAYWAWNSTAAIASIQIKDLFSYWCPGTKFSLYGISNS
jgi:hypothetical protein